VTAPPLRVAVVGSGPAGFYAAAHLLACEVPRFAVDLIERLPTPFGLVRAGVAPDHPKIKTVTRAFEKTAEHPRLRFFGDVELGGDVTRDDLLDGYHAVVYAVGAAADRRLGVPGESLRGVHSATEFVAWYNGHPDHCSLALDVGVRRAVVVGAGNVALDVARMLALAPSELAGTDAADHAIEALSRSQVEEITIVARRGPLQAAFTNPELREMGGLERARLEVVGAELDPLSANALSRADKTRRRNVEILHGHAGHGRDGRRPITIRLRFLAAPAELLGDGDGRVRAVRLGRTEMARGENGSLVPCLTGEHDIIPCELVVRAIGYKGVPLPGLPFDADRGVVKNDDGRVCGEDKLPLPGEYVAGWIKRGPSGVIGTNKKDAQETVAALIQDALTSRLNAPPHDGDPAELLVRRRRRPVDWAGWRRIDAVERKEGQREGRSRMKLTRWSALRRAAAAPDAYEQPSTADVEDGPGATYRGAPTVSPGPA
jgi:ferredoxin/flavodoxin---NADP+ reductase